MTTAAEAKKKEVPLGFGEVTEKNVELVRILNTAMFPVRYQDRFYEELVKPANSKKNILAFYGYDILVGAICCRIEPPKPEDPPGTSPRLYIMTLAVLGPYQRLGIATRLFEKMMERIPTEWPEVQQVYLHVQTNNEKALAFYSKLGFKVEKKIEGYYKNISPPDCFVLTRDVPKTATPAPPHRK